MAHWPLPDLPTLQGTSTHSVASTGSGPVTVTGSGTAHTKGSWAELITSTSTPVTSLVLYVSDTATTNTNTSCLLDIGVGASGSETVIVDNLGVGFAGPRANMQGRKIEIPMQVPAGTRIAVRLQSVITSKTCQVSCTTFGGMALPGATPVGPTETYGANTATSRGVTVTPNATANTKGSWTEITSGTTSPIRALLVTVQGNGQASMSGRDHLLDIGVGASGSETVLFADLYYRDNTSEVQLELLPGGLLPIQTPLPAGTRLSARTSASGASENTTDVILVGVR